MDSKYMTKDKEEIEVVDKEFKVTKYSYVFDEDANGYIYSDDGNTRIEIDCYGEPLKVASLKSVIIKLKKIVRETDYRRAKIALAFLESVYEVMPECKVYHYGH